MEYEDRITITAPEGIELEYTLAGLGSRFIAAFVDVSLRVAVLAAVIGVIAALGGRGALLVITFLVGSFLALFAYDIVFEVWASGRTPGKRWSGLRVLMMSGGSVSFTASAVRNIMRIVDVWGTVLIAGVVTILVTKRNQRLGDLAAGTIVVRERRDAGVMSVIGEAPAAHAGIDVTAVTASELATIRDFLGRRERLAPDARARVAHTLADGVAGKIGGIVPGSLESERLLETIVAAKAGAPSRYGSSPFDPGG